MDSGAGPGQQVSLTYRQSDFSAFLSCRRSWAMGYRLNLCKPKVAPSVAGIGTLFHLGAQAHYEGASKTDVLWAVRERATADRLEIVSPAWLAKHDSNSKMALAMIAGYVDWVEREGKDVGWTVQGTEREINVEWPGRPGVFVTGRLDLEITDRWGLLKLVDFKTRTSVNPSFADSIDFQRKAYAVLRMLEDGQVYAGAIHRYARRVLRGPKAVPPFYGEYELVFSKETLVRHFQVMDAMLAEMIPLSQHVENLGAAGLTDTRLYPNPTKDCDWRCPFTDVCQAVDEGGHEYLLQEFFVTRGNEPEEAHEGE